MKMFATDYAIEVKCSICKLEQTRQPIACLYTLEEKGFYFELFICKDCLSTLTSEVIEHGNKMQKHK